MTKRIDLPFIVRETETNNVHAQGVRVDNPVSIVVGTVHDTTPGRPKPGYIAARDGAPLPEGVNALGQRTNVAVNLRDVGFESADNVPGRRVLGNRILDDLQAQIQCGIPADRVLPIKWRQLFATYLYSYDEALDLYKRGIYPNRYQREKHRKLKRTP